MDTLDYNTGGFFFSQLYCWGGTIFKGSSSSRATRTPTSLMTEWYHASPSEPSMKQVTYSEQNVPISSAWICISEYAPSNPNTSVFGQCSSDYCSEARHSRTRITGLTPTLTSTCFKQDPLDPLHRPPNRRPIGYLRPSHIWLLHP